MVSQAEYCSRVLNDTLSQIELSLFLLCGENGKVLEFIDAQTRLDPNYPHQVTSYAISRIPLNGMHSPLVARDTEGRALVYSENNERVPCPFGCATRCKARTQLCGHAIDKHSDQVLLIPRRKFFKDLTPHYCCGRCHAVFDNSTLARHHQQFL